MIISLRPYQSEAIAATWDYLRTNAGSPLVVLPTGAGKSCVVATLCQQAVEQWNGRILVLSHVRELIGQLYETMRRVWPLAPCGINSAGLKRRDYNDQIVIASIQSVFRDGADLGRFDLIIIDEAHLVPADGEGMYRTLLETLRIINPAIRLIGLTATPFRLDSGWLYGPDQLFEGVAYDANVRTLIDQGYLCKLRGKDGGAPDLSKVHIRGGEYIPAELDAAVNTPEHVKDACREIITRSNGRQGWLVFCCSVEHAFMVKDQLAGMEISCAIVIGETPSEERKAAIDAFKAKELRCLVSVGVLTTGFDAPHVDLIALLRPTLSPGLYYQMVGRGLRITPGKTDCLVLDFADCISTHGPIDDLIIRDKRSRATSDAPAPVKTCPQCQEILPASATVCHACGHEMPREMKHKNQADNADPLKNYTEEWVDVTSVTWSEHMKKGASADAPRTLRISYGFGFYKQVSEWVCVEHFGYARKKAETWWKETTGFGELSCPNKAPMAVAILDKFNIAELRFPKRLLLRFGDQWPEIIGHDYGPPRPAMREPGADEEEPAYKALVHSADSEEIPF